MKKISLIFIILMSFIGHVYSIDLHLNDRIVFVGNSLTHAGSYHAIVRSYLATRFHQNVVVFNKGVSGDVAQGMIERLENDILKDNPTIAFVMSGMNDVCRETYCLNATDKQKEIQRTALIAYKQRMDILVNKLLEHNVRVVLLTPTIFEESSCLSAENHIGVNAALGKCAEFVKEIAAKKHLEVVDLHDVLNELNRIEQMKDPNFTIVGKDRVHPGDLGHLVMAYQIINTVLGKDSIVSDIVVNAKKKEVILASNTSVQNLRCTRKSVVFDVLNQSLPMALSEYDRKAQEMFPVCTNLNKEGLSLIGLEKGDYEFYINDECMGLFSDTQLAKGIRLDNLHETPQYKNAREIAKMSNEIKELERLMRDIKFVDYKLFKQDLADKTAKERVDKCKAKLEELKKSESCNPYFVQTITTYIKHVGKISDYRHRISHLESLINKLSIPTKQCYRLVKVKK